MSQRKHLDGHSAYIDYGYHRDKSTGEINLCSAFFQITERHKTGLPQFTEAITELEELMDVAPVHDESEAVQFIQAAINFAQTGRYNWPACNVGI